ncbi:MAG: flagellar assembly protein FliW [Gemmatimonadales bacterium]
MPASSAAVARVMSRRIVPTKLFGSLDVGDDQIIVLPEGMFGFPSCREWVLIDGARPGTAWLQSAENAALAFLLVDPFVLFDGFSADLATTDLRRLRADDPSQIAVFAIVTLPAGRGGEATANLQGPVVINVHERLGAQVVVESSRWAVRQALPESFLA